MFIRKFLCTYVVHNFSCICVCVCVRVCFAWSCLSGVAGVPTARVCVSLAGASQAAVSAEGGAAPAVPV